MLVSNKSLGALLLLGFAFAPRAEAQYWFNPDSLQGGIMGVAPGPAAADYLMGMAQVVRSQGEYNLDTSQAYINYEEARSRYIQNRQRWTQVYFAMREHNEAHRAAALRRNRYSPETLAAAARSGIPRPLSNDVFDPLTGRLQWPELLEDDLFAEHRRIIEQLLKLRAVTQSTRNHSRALAEATREMISTLKENIHELPVHEYIVARKFLDRLAVSG